MNSCLDKRSCGTIAREMHSTSRAYVINDAAFIEECSQQQRHSPPHTTRGLHSSTGHAAVGQCRTAR